MQAQLVTVQRETERLTVAEARKTYQISDAIISSWPKHFGLMEASAVNCLKSLELDNMRLKKILAECDLDIEILKELNAKKW